MTELLPIDGRERAIYKREGKVLVEVMDGLVYDWDDPAFTRWVENLERMRLAEERRMRELGYETYYDEWYRCFKYRRILSDREKIEQEIANIDRRIDFLLCNIPFGIGEWRGEAYIERWDLGPSYFKAATDAAVGRLIEKQEKLKAQLAAMNDNGSNEHGGAEK